MQNHGQLEERRITILRLDVRTPRHTHLRHLVIHIQAAPRQEVSVADVEARTLGRY